MGWYTNYKKKTVKAEVESGQGAKLNDLIVNQLVGPIVEMTNQNLLEPFNAISVEAGQAMYSLLQQNPETLGKILLVIKNQEIQELATLSKEYSQFIKPALEAYDMGDRSDFDKVLVWVRKVKNLKSFSTDNLFVSIFNQAQQISESI